jgi:CRP-like cAMP-binding protein
LPHNALIRKLESTTVLSEDERAAILALPAAAKEFAADRDIVCEGDRPTQCCLLVEGFLCRYKMTPDGNRQIISFHVSGDIPDLRSLHLDVMDHSLATITASKVALIPHEAVRKLTHSQPRIADAFWRDTLLDGSIFQEWIVNLGSRDAYSRIAHLLCEIFTKLRAVGIVTGNSFELPLTQSEIGDATGLSTVHVNRSLMQLRADGLITLERYLCTIPDFGRLEQAAMFDPSYLHLRDTAPGASIPAARALIH